MHSHSAYREKMNEDDKKGNIIKLRKNCWKNLFANNFSKLKQFWCTLSWNLFLFIFDSSFRPQYAVNARTYWHSRIQFTISPLMYILTQRLRVLHIQLFHFRARPPVKSKNKCFFRCCNKPKNAPRTKEKCCIFIIFGNASECVC